MSRSSFCSASVARCSLRSTSRASRCRSWSSADSPPPRLSGRGRGAPAARSPGGSTAFKRAAASA